MAHPRAGARVAGEQDLDAVVEILVGAFYADPTWSWAFPDPARRPAQHRALWRLFAAGALRYPWVWLTAGDTATAVWIPPGGTDLSPEQEADFEPAVEALAGPDAGRVFRALELFEQAHPRDVPHFYLSLLGTDPQHRGHGYGLGLLADNLRHVDEAHAPAYLEASNPVNVALYARYGFVVHGSFTLPDGGPEVFTMWREPLTAGR